MSCWGRYTRTTGTMRPGGAPFGHVKSSAGHPDGTGSASGADGRWAMRTGL